MLRAFPITLLLCSVSAVAAVSRPVPEAQAALARLPLRFEANQGQFDRSVRYAARAGYYHLLLTPRGAALALPGAHRIDLSLLHSNASPVLEPLDRLSTRTDYFVGARDNWHENVPSYSRVRYRDVYPGIDVVYYGRNNQLEYDFVLQPGADPRAIRLAFRGARGLAITSEGDVAFETGSGRMVQKRPIIYQEGREVQGRYVLLSRNVLGLKLEKYDRSRPLTIDPLLLWSTYVGGTASDSVIGTRIDARGRLYVVGATDHSTDPNNPDKPATGNTYQAQNNGFTDAFIAVLDTTNSFNLLYYSYLGGSQIDTPNAMQIDSNGWVYITGSTNSTDFPTGGAAIQTTGTGAAKSVFLTVIDPGIDTASSQLIYSTYLGTNSGDSTANGIDVDAQGNIYLIGTTRASDFPVTTSGYQQVLWGPQDAFLAEINIYNSNMLYATFLGGESDDDGRSIVVTPQGLVYFAIDTVSQQFPQAGNQYSPVLKGQANIAIGLMDMTKFGVDSLLYTTYFGGSRVDEVRKIALDANGNLLVTGHTLSPDLPVTGDAAQMNYGGNGDVFVAIVNANNPAFISYLTYLGGSHGEVAYDIASDNAGFLYVTGYTLSSDFPVTPDAPQPVWQQATNVFLTKLKPGMPGPTALKYSTYLGGATTSVAYGLALGGDGTVYIVGSTSGLWPTTDNPLQPGFGGGYTDGFIAAIK